MSKLVVTGTSIDGIPVARIELTKGATALVDEADLGLVSAHSWHLQSKGYAASRIANRIVMMHNLIMNPPAELRVDHVKSLFKTDNRRSNLRLVTSQQNSFNTSSHKDSTSRFKGVFWRTQYGCWTAAIRVDRKKMHLGSFGDNEEAAACAYDEAARKYFGEFANLNFPQS